MKENRLRPGATRFGANRLLGRARWDFNRNTGWGRHQHQPRARANGTLPPAITSARGRHAQLPLASSEDGRGFQGDLLAHLLDTKHQKTRTPHASHPWTSTTNYRWDALAHSTPPATHPDLVAWNAVRTRYARPHHPEPPGRYPSAGTSSSRSIRSIGVKTRHQETLAPPVHRRPAPPPDSRSFDGPPAHHSPAHAYDDRALPRPRLLRLRRAPPATSPARGIDKKSGFI
jgi:hypothetical protein